MCVLFFFLLSSFFFLLSLFFVGLANVLAARHLADIFPHKQHGVQFFAVNPGLVDTVGLEQSGLNRIRGMPVKDGIRGECVDG